MKREDFSVVCTVLNEEKGLPRLLKSLEGVKDIVIMDTGSNDKTVEIAKKWGCNVVEVGEKFKYGPKRGDIKKWEKKFGFKPAFKMGDKYFHYADARNHAAKFAKNDWVFTPDGDEEMHWDIEKVRDAIQDADQLVYSFVFAHKQDGTPGLQFTQCKFYRRSMFKWTKWIHEVITPKKGKKPRPPKYETGC